MEIWKDIEGYEGLYKISNLGNVKSFVKNKEGIIKKLYTREPGYKFVGLVRPNEKSKTVRVHRLVANAFLEKVEGKEYVNHIDGDASNNNVENLEWCTISENNEHSMKIIMSKNSCHRYSEEIVRDYVENDLSMNQIAKKYKGNASTVKKILKEKGVEFKEPGQKRMKYVFDRKEFLKCLEKGERIIDVSKKFKIPYDIAKAHKRLWKEGKYKIYE